MTGNVTNANLVLVFEKPGDVKQNWEKVIKTKTISSQSSLTRALHFLRAYVGHDWGSES